MSETSPHYLNGELLSRVEQLFDGLSYENILLEDWLDDETATVDDPLLIMSREIYGRDILHGPEVTAEDTLLVSQLACGKLIIERIVYLETEDDDEETIDHYALNMYSGEIDALYPEGQQYPVQNFENRFRIVEDI